jgi:class 3 adenylate cyclase
VLRAQEAVSRIPHDPPLVLKAALHAGTCIAVTLNERLDYFGSTVNVAARLAGLSEGDDIVMSDCVRDDPGVKAIMESRDIRPESFRAAIRGVEDDAMLWRVRR